MKIDPVVFSIGPLEVRWYGIAMAGALLFGIWYLVTKGKSKGLSQDHLVVMSLLVMIFGIVGARLMYVAANHPNWFWEEPIQIMKTYEGGLAYLYLKYRAKISFNQVADLCVPAIALGYFLIRLANIPNVENIGRMTGFYFGRWPAQLIAAGINLTLLLRHFLISKKNLPDGHLFWSFLFYHQILRASIEESIRAMPLVYRLYVNDTLGIGFLTLVQVTTLPVLIFIGWILWFYIRKESPNK